MATYAQQRRALSDRLIRALVKLFTGLGSWRDADVRTFVRQAVPLVRAGQLSMADLVASHMAATASQATGRPVAPLTIPERLVTDLRGVDPAEVYARPFVTLRTTLAEGQSLTEAVEHGAARVREVAEGDMQQAYAHANQQAMQRLPEAARPRYWRRVLTGDENCGLCILAASNRYTVEDLNPIHPGCDCEVAAVFGRDTHRAGDDALAARAQQAIQELTGRRDAGGRAVDYRQILIQDHGELGPMLAKPRDRFTGPDAIPRRTDRSKR